MQTGTVKYFDATKGYGFIVRDDDGSDEFVHVSDVHRSGLDALAKGQRVQFELGQNTRNGRSKAINLRVVQ